jgi:cyanamide hydratase
MTSPIERYGWTPVPRSLDKLISNRTDPQPSSAIKVEDIPLPNTELAQQVLRYAKEHLPKETFNHSMRVYYYGQAISKQHFPSWQFTPETYLLASLLHDIGTIPANQTSTNLSFEFQGGFIALELLKNHLHAAVPQAESVCETIIRHQDLGETGNVSVLTAVIHFATVMDNAGLHPEVLHEDTIKNVVKAFPRNGWTGCFAGVVRKECELKPWANTSRIEGFAEMVEANEVMRAYD